MQLHSVACDKVSVQTVVTHVRSMERLCELGISNAFRLHQMCNWLYNINLKKFSWVWLDDMDCWAGDVLGDSQERSQTISSFFRDQQVYWTVHLCFYSYTKRSGNIPWGFFIQLSWIYGNIVPGTSNIKTYKWWRLKLKKPFTYTAKHLLTILEFLISLRLNEKYQYYYLEYNHEKWLIPGNTEDRSSEY